MGHWDLLRDLFHELGRREESMSLRSIYGGQATGSGRKKSWVSLFSGCGLALLLGLPLLTGCGKSGIAAELAEFKSTGHSVSEFADIDAGKLGAKRCQTGTVDQLPVLLCEYPNTEAAAAGHTAAEAWGGETGTVVVLRRGSTLFAMADRTHIDPNGKAISALARVFRRAKSR